MASMGKPIIVPGPAGYWLLGHETKHGIQTSIENFSSITDAKRFCDRHGMRASVDLVAAKVTFTDCAVLCATATMCGGKLKDAARAAKTNVSMARKSAQRLVGAGLASVEAPATGSKPGDHVIRLTEGGLGMASALIGSHTPTTPTQEGSTHG